MIRSFISSCGLAILVALSPPTAIADESLDALLATLKATQSDAAASEADLALAAALVEKIILEHPTSDAAVSIVLQEPYEGIDFASFQERLKLKQAEAADDPVSDPVAPELPNDVAPEIAEADQSFNDPLSCVRAKLGAAPDQTLILDVPIGAGGEPSSLPVLTSPEAPSSAQRVLFLKLALALETCSPLVAQGASERLQVIASADGQLLFAPLANARPELEVSVVEPRSEKEIIKEVQSELNRIGCDVGTADGVAGRKTRSAFSRFLTNTGSALDETAFNTEAAVLELKAQDGQICETLIMANVAASTLSGRWGFRGECPGLFGRTVKNNGRLQLRYAGNNTLSGTATNQQGLTGPATLRFSGRTAVTKIRFGAFTLNGNLTRSSRNMTISGTGNRDCKIVLWKN